jgi:hypothetical protein
MRLYTFAVVAVLSTFLSGCGGGKPSPTPTPTATTTVPPSHDPVIIKLAAFNSSNETGTATLEQSQDHWQTIVTIAITGEPAGVVQYAFFQYGPCKDIANGKFSPNILFPLTNVADGKSKSVHDLSLPDFDASGPGDGSGHNPNGCTGCSGPGSTTLNGSNSNPPSTYAVTVWNYTTTGQKLISCGEQQML